MPRFIPSFWTLSCLLSCVLFATTARADDTLEYNRDVRPILAEGCFACHGPDSVAREADLRLDQREAAIEMGAITPGDVDESEMIRRIFSDDEAEVMPPPTAHNQLKPEQKEVLRQWVAQGAEYQPHWSFIPPTRPELPTVQNTAWPRNEIDYFVLARMEAAGLTPNETADRWTLARRASLDITGLPPDAEVVEAFVADESPDAYEKLIDTLLASPRWGEHRGRYWLDYARYADTHGAHFDNFREMWSYRDWVIKAHNANMPFDEFTVENLAGDLLPDRTLDQQIASGFNRCNLTTNEGGIIDEEYLVLYTRDRTETTSHVWLGITANCAVCHDHKFDPLSQREFYEMSAFFNNTTQGARDGNIKDTPPIVVVPTAEDRDRWAELKTAVPAAKAQLEARRGEARGDFDAWLAAATPAYFQSKLPTGDLVLHAPLDEGTGDVTRMSIEGQVRKVALRETAHWLPGHVGTQAVELTQGAACELADVGDFDGSKPFSCGAWVRLPANDGGGAIVARMDNDHDYRGWDLWVEGRRVGMHIIHRWQEDALKVVSKDQVPANEWTHVLVTYDGSQKAAGVKVYINGNEQQTNVQADQLKNTAHTDVPLKIGQRNTASLLSGTGVQDVRLYERTLQPNEVQNLAQSTRYAAIVATAVDQRDAKDVDELYGWWLGALDETFRTRRDRLATLEREQSDIQARGTVAHVMQEREEPASAYVLYRGEYDQRREQVLPETPDVMPPFPEALPRNRLGFARWLLLPEHPLTARVTVNRYWQEVFGTGIVATTGDFGVTGELPSHPQLLDWLAVDFRESGWDVKRLFKQILMSATYRQSARVTPEKLERDPANRLLARGPRYRMDAEMVRDYALDVSGLMTGDIGGPSVKPYQPSGVWEAIAMNVSNTRKYEPDSGAALYRRSLYTFWKRMAPPASLEIMNAPNREYCVVKRERTNTPLQALVTLNDEQFVEAARQLASSCLNDAAGSTQDRLRDLGQRVLLRPVNDEELAILERSLAELTEYYAAHPEDAAELLAVGESPVDESLPADALAAWTMLANEVFNLDEVLNK
ncbi:MAG: DUF1553 domain-containing protein [Planctomycetales bacterium]|nr:DUF1553 domain-containing protein [Planctomycetales bacterium]